MTCLLSSPRLKRFCLRQHWVVMLSFISPTSFILVSNFSFDGQNRLPLGEEKSIVTSNIVEGFLDFLACIVIKVSKVQERPILNFNTRNKVFSIIEPLSRILR